MTHHIERKTLREVKLDLARAGATKVQLALPEVRELCKVLFEKEDIKAFVSGFYDGGYGMLVATNLRLLFVDVMPFGRVKVDDVPYSAIASTEMQLGIFLGKITIFTRPNTYSFWWLKKDNVHDFNKYVELQMLKHQQENVEID